MPTLESWGSSAVDNGASLSADHHRAAEIRSFLQGIQGGQPFYVEDTERGWTKAEFLGLSDGGLQGQIVRVSVDGEERSIYPAILCDAQKRYQTFREQAS